MDMDEERVDADADTPLTAEVLARAYDAIFTPIDRDEVELTFDPDDYGLI